MLYGEHVGLEKRRARTSRRTFLLGSSCFLSMLEICAVPAHAGDYPSRPVRLIVDSAPGSAVDTSARIIAEGLSRRWGQQVVTVNQPGGGGAIAVRAAAAAAPDGYTLAMPALSAFVARPGATANLPIHVPGEFVPVGYLTGAPMFITAAPSLGVASLAELIALAKKRPGELAYATNGGGRLTHLTGELLQQRAGIKLLMVPYSGGTARVLTDVMGGRIALLFESYSGVASAVAAGTVRPLAVASHERLALLPDLPTVAETLPGFEAVGWQVLVAPAGTSDAIVHKVNADLTEVLADAEVRTRLAQIGRYERPMSPSETLAFIHREQQRWAPIVEQTMEVR
jgi:tripartite-type tricarboxylate transporter receptor subunit TctC